MTEKAKRDMMEARKAAITKKRPEDEDFAAARCMFLILSIKIGTTLIDVAFLVFRPTLRVASDIYAIEDAKREAAGLPIASKQIRIDGPKHETATDEQVYDRFKKR